MLSGNRRSVLIGAATETKEGKEQAMKALRRIWTWWRALWEWDFYESDEVDSHRWENKVEMLRRLSHG